VNATETHNAIAYLDAHGFTRDPATGWYDHATGRARMVIDDAEAACLTVYAFTADRAHLLKWRIQLYYAPLAVVAATATAATT
jgi:hypothetical protein